MNINTIIRIFFDPYDRKARLAPALLAILVPAIAFSIVSPAFIKHLNWLFSITVAFGGLIFLSSVARDLGKKKQAHLFQQWGGSPTTLMLMHSTTDLDPITLNRYHTTIENNISRFKFLTKSQESTDMDSARARCESAIKWLLEASRNPKKYPLVFAENINYGFRRNLLGIKSLAIAFCILTFACLLSDAWLVTHGCVFLAPRRFWMGAGISFLGCLIWMFFVDANQVKTVAFAYATALLAACDSVALTKTKKRLDQ